MQDESSALSAQLQDSVLERLGFLQPPSADLDGLRALYLAWCAKVPFDNGRKMLALRSQGSASLPGGQAADFFASWLADGCGATCWPSSNALYELLRSLGFEARRIVGCMRDLGLVNHGSVSVRMGDQAWLVDSSLLFNVPLPLAGAVFVQPDPVFAAEIESTEDGYRLWVDVPPNPAYMPCRLLAEEATHAQYLSYYESSRQRSPFNQRLYARRNRAGELLLLLGATRYSKTAQGLAQRELDAEQLVQALRDDIGWSERLIEDWVRSGGLEGSLQAPTGPKPPPLTALAPSQRGGKPVTQAGD